MPSADRITLLRDADGDGKAEVRSVLLKNLTSPFGMALVDSVLYVANTDALVRFPYAAGDTVISLPGAKVVDLPAGPINDATRDWVSAKLDARQIPVGDLCKAFEVTSLKALTYEQLDAVKDWIRDHKKEAA